MFWLYLLIPFVVLCGAAGVINRRRRRSFSYDSESAAQSCQGSGGEQATGTLTRREDICGDCPSVLL